MNKSENITKLTSAMVEVQKEIKGMTPDAKNPFFKSKYITLDGILEYIRPILSKNGIWLTQEAKGLDGCVSVTTTLFHNSGEYIVTESLEMTPIKNDPQTMGSTLTYQKRYQLAALLGISSEVDDDGNRATGNTIPKEDIKLGNKKIDAMKVTVIKNLMVKAGTNEANFLKWAKVDKVENILVGNFVECTMQLEKAVKAHNEVKK